MKIVFRLDAQVPVKTYGGTERIAYWHMCELAKRGHQVILIGHADSDVTNNNIQLIPNEFKNKDDWYKLIPSDADIVHLQYNSGPVLNFPTINTIHGNGKVGEKFYQNSVFVSKKHAENHGSKVFVHNALNLNEYPFVNTTQDSSWDNFLFLGKASWRVKNLKLIAKACREMKKHLHVVGGRWFGLSRYIHNYGMLGGEKKLNIIRKINALIFTVLWEEPFGIAVIEAMSQGKPVIVTPYGSLPELVNKEVGIIVRNYSELKLALANTPKFDPIRIRKYIEDNFSIEKYTDQYLLLYQNVINGEMLNDSQPICQFQVRAEDLLPF